MANLDIVARLTDQASGPAKEIDRNIDRLGSTARGPATAGFRNLQSVGKVALAGIAAGAVAAGAAVVGLGSKLIGLGSDAEEMQGKFNVVFANTGGEVAAQLDEFAAAVGRSRFELMGMASTFGDTLKPMGFTEAAAADMSVQLTQLATDLGSFNNMSMDEALQRLQGTLIGSHENALAFGVIINENTLKAKLAEMGLDDLTGAALEQAKVQARMALLMEGTTDAQGDALRTSASWANQMRALKSTMTDTATEIGLKLLPAVTPLLQMIGQMAKDALPILVGILEGSIIPALMRFANWITITVQAIQSGGFEQLFHIFEDGSSRIESLLQVFGLSEEAARGLATGFIELVETVRTFLEPIIAVVTQFVSWQDVLTALGIAVAAVVIPAIISIITTIAPLIAVFAVVTAAVALLRNAWENDWGGIQEKTQAVISFVSNLVTTVMTAVREFWAANGDEIMAKAQAVWETIKVAVQTAIEVIQQIITTVFGQLQIFWEHYGEAIMLSAKTAWEAIVTTVEDAIALIVKIKDAFVALFQGDWEEFGRLIVEIFIDAWALMIKQVEDAFNIIIPIIAQLVLDIIGKFQDIDWKEVGLSIIDGIAGGIKAGAGAIIEAAKGAAQAALDAAKAALGISSPSRLFAEIGMQTAQGFALGIQQSRGIVAAAAGGMSRTAAIAAGNSSVVNNTYQVNASYSYQSERGVRDDIRTLQLLNT